MKKILLIIDPQYDFINGSLPVNNAEEKMINLVNYLKEEKQQYDVIIMTKDSHPNEHISFTIWPKHCVQSTHGCQIYQPLIDMVSDKNVIFITKGNKENQEEYSIFQNPESRQLLDIIIHHDDIVDICGIAGDICVLNTLQDFLSIYDKKNINLLKDFTPCIDENKLTSFISEYDISIK